MSFKLSPLSEHKSETSHVECEIGLTDIIILYPMLSIIYIPSIIFLKFLSISTDTIKRHLLCYYLVMLLR